MDSTIRLFKALPIKTKRRKKASAALLHITAERGFIFSPEVIFNYSEAELINIVDNIGLTPAQMNSSFHKSWQKVKKADMKQLILEQIIHYFSTYGLKAFGAYNNDSIYIPNEKLQIPELKDGIHLTIIKGYTDKELKAKLLNLLSSGIALKQESIKDIIDISHTMKLTSSEIEGIRNKEVKIIMYDNLKLLPTVPTEFLRYLVYKATGKTLLIKSPGAIIEIVESEFDAAKLLAKYDKVNGIENLAQIFYRFKPLFLAFRNNGKSKVIINRIRRMAKVHHKLMPEDFLDTVTAKLKLPTSFNKAKLVSELGRVNVFRKIRLAYALKYRTKHDTHSILYRIRNGKSYATDFDFPNPNRAQNILNMVLNSIALTIKPNVKGKKIFIPETIQYALPATEKQFTGSIPSGSCIIIPKDMVMGVHWSNVDNRQIDLDLSLIDSKNGKIGWNTAYRNEERSILFSGDITSAPNGASELFYVRKQSKNAFIVLLNYYNYDESIEVPFKIMVAKEQVKNMKQNYTINPNNMILTVDTKIKERQKVLGLVVTRQDSCKFYFAETGMGKQLSSSDKEYVKQGREYLFASNENNISLKDVLIKSGAKMVTDKDKCDIDLSPENLEKDTILNLLK